MTPATIIRAAQADGVRLTLSPAGTIRLAGDGAVVNRWLAVIREHKSDIIRVLRAANDPLKAIDGVGDVKNASTHGRDRNLRDGGTSCTTSTNRNPSGSCGRPNEAELSEASGVIRHHPAGGQGCIAWRPPAPDPLEGLPPDVADLIRRAGECYDYDVDDYRLIAEVARRDPEAMRRALEADALLMTTLKGMR